MNAELARSLWLYDPITGALTWRKTGKRAGHRHCRDGYHHVVLGGQRYPVHRVCWLITHGELPEQIDHINMVRWDNRLSNLRPATNTENIRNRPKQSNNTSGFKGVSFSKITGKYQARIMFNKKRLALGQFTNPREGAEAYAKAAKELHGQFARF